MVIKWKSEESTLAEEMGLFFIKKGEFKILRKVTVVNTFKMETSKYAKTSKEKEYRPMSWSSLRTKFLRELWTRTQGGQWTRLQCHRAYLKRDAAETAIRSWSNALRREVYRQLDRVWVSSVSLWCQKLELVTHTRIVSDATTWSVGNFQGRVLTPLIWPYSCAIVWLREISRAVRLNKSLTSCVVIADIKNRTCECCLLI